MKPISPSPSFRLRLLRLSVMLLMLTSFMACASSWPSKIKPHIQPVDIQRYAGVWYEIARFPHRFERGLQGVTATYTLLPDGKIKVENKGYKNSLEGASSSVIGKAKPAGDPSLGHLKVSFFWIFYADYYILALDKEDYQWALVGSSSPKYLWILSRTPQLEPEIYDQLISRASMLGYDITKLEQVSQPPL